MLDVSGCHAKIARAKEHIAEFNLKRIAFLDTNPYVITTKFNPSAQITESIMGPMPTIPNNLYTIVGDAIQNLRTALDYLAAELVRSNGNDPKLVYFPIFETAEKYKAESKGKTKGMSVEAKEFIDSIEPYCEGSGNDLWFLHTLNNGDKHKLLMSVATNLSPQVVFTLSPGPNTFSTIVDTPGLKEGDILGSITGDSEGAHRIKFTFDIAFAQPDAIAGEPVLQTLEYMAFMVESIVEQTRSSF